MKPQFPLLITVLCLLALSNACPPAHAADDATPPPWVPAPAGHPGWLGDPGVDIEKARARLHERYSTAMRWNIDYYLAAYERAGRKDSRWDADVRETFRNASALSPDDPDGPAASRAERAGSARAVARGCDDPLIIYLWLRCGNYPPGTSKEKLAQLYTKAEAAMAASGYPPLRKYFAAVRAVENDIACRQGDFGIAGEPEIGETNPAVSWPDGTDVTIAYRHGLTQLEALLKDPEVPTILYYDTTKDFLEEASEDTIGRTEVLEPLEKFFTAGEPKGQSPAVSKMFAGRFWTTYALDARGTLGTSQMSPDLMKLYCDRLEKAMALLEQSWSLDSTEAEVTRNMITAAASRGRPFTEIDKWLRRAMDVKPNYYDAALAYLRFIEPHWGGSSEKMLTFGHQCFDSQDARSRLPFILLDVHYRLARDSDDPAAYWRRPEVWADMHNLFEFYVKALPDQPSFRTGYAIYAWRAGDWQVAREQFDLVGDRPDLGELQNEKCSREQFQDMRREVADRTAVQ